MAHIDETIQNLALCTSTIWFIMEYQKEIRNGIFLNGLKFNVRVLDLRSLYNY